MSKKIRPKTKEQDTKRWAKYLKIVKLKEPKMDTVIDKDKIEEVISRGVKDIFPSKKELRDLMLSGKRLRIYTGIDPTANFLHVGHFIWMRRLAKFQKLGHQVIFLIGAFTAMIGDPDKEYTRAPLTKEKVWDNFKSYKSTAKRLIDFEWEKNPVTILNNYDWLAKLTLEDWLQIMGKVTIQHILSHDMFKTRIEKQKPIRLHEIMYPLMQGFDGVAMQVDLEQGGSDQTFNMLTGRLLSRELIGKEKFVLTNKLLTDPTGSKMGKTTGNAISSLDKPEDMYGKVMSWPDEMLVDAYELLTDIDIKSVKILIDEGKQMHAKKQLAFEVVKMVHDEKSAKSAEKHFEKVVQKGELPKDIDQLEYKGKDEALALIKFLVKNGAIPSNTEAKRLIKQGAIEIEGKKLKSLSQELKLAPGTIIKIGKRNYIRLK